MNDIKKINLKTLTIMISLFTMVLSTTKVYAVDKIEGGNVTIESLGSIIKSLATKVQIFGIVLSFIALVVFAYISRIVASVCPAILITRSHHVLNCYKAGCYR